jgi:hypothetical protein
VGHFNQRHGGPGVKKGGEHEYDIPQVTTVGSSVGEPGRGALSTISGGSVTPIGSAGGGQVNQEGLILQP